jgi:hypothetical protein
MTSAISRPGTPSSSAALSTTPARLATNVSMALASVRVAALVMFGTTKARHRTRERLETAALDLFAENGYEQTTVAQIADRAGLNRATFFRHFADKREVLFGGKDVLAGLLGDGIRAAPPDATLTECLQAAFTAAEVAMIRSSGLIKPQRVQVCSTASIGARRTAVTGTTRLASARCWRP